MKILYDYALQFVGIPYIYGGENPAEGLDCSALVRWLLKSQGVRIDGSGNSQSLFNQFSKKNSGTKAGLGALVFYGKGATGINHVAMCLDENLHIEAGGGSPTVLTRGAAFLRTAFVRISPIRVTDRQAIFMPEFPFRPTE